MAIVGVAIDDDGSGFGGGPLPERFVGDDTGAAGRERELLPTDSIVDVDNVNGNGNDAVVDEAGADVEENDEEDVDEGDVIVREADEGDDPMVSRAGRGGSVGAAAVDGTVAVAVDGVIVGGVEEGAAMS
jgi:hypothetical protein